MIKRIDSTGYERRANNDNTMPYGDVLNHAMPRLTYSRTTAGWLSRTASKHTRGSNAVRVPKATGSCKHEQCNIRQPERLLGDSM
jgi:hypothetical protein